MCELFECAVIIENEYRKINCPEYPKLEGCPDPEGCSSCKEAHTCDEIAKTTSKVMEFYDKNNDGWLDLADADGKYEDLVKGLMLCDWDKDS